MEQVNKRKGPRSTTDINPEVLKLLNQGLIESANLQEWLAIDQLEVVRHILPEVDLQDWIEPIEQAVYELPKRPATLVTQTIGITLLRLFQANPQRSKSRPRVFTHVSDTVRCWATYIVGFDQSINLGHKLDAMYIFASDPHFGVREFAWMALRPSIEGNLNRAISLLAEWTGNEDENIRRFTSEATRPRGVWSKHINALKTSPELGLPILNPLKSDPSKYVQDSVSNWLNDAAKSRPDWVEMICDKWMTESPTPETRRIVKRAQRGFDS